MGRRRRPEGAFTFDLVPDDGTQAGDRPAASPVDAGPAADLPADVPPSDRDREPGPVRRTWQRFSRRTRLAALVTVAAVAGVVLVVDGMLDQGRHEELRTAAGGVVDLSAPPAEAWRVGDAGDAPPQEVSLAAVTDGVAMVQREDELRGVDLVTGQERWVIDLLDSRARCGPGVTLWSDVAEITPASRVVCVADGQAGAATATVVTADGTVLARRQLEGEQDLVAPGPDGTLLTASWVGEPDDVDVELHGDPMTDLTVIGEIDDGYDLLVRLSDAVTGEERWERRVAFDEVRDERQCVRWTTGGRDMELARDGDVDHLTSGRLLAVSACGVLAYFTPSGEQLDLSSAQAAGDDVARRVQPLADGGYAVFAAVWGQQAWTYGVLDAAGQERLRVEGRLLDPWATDGPADGELLLATEAGLTAVDAEGAERWTADVEADEQLARAGGVTVVLDQRDRVLGLDRATGDVLWVREDLTDLSSVEGATGRGGEVESVFTDGSVVALVVPDYGDTGVVSRWLAVDATTGEDLWSAAVPHEGWGVDLAVEGQIVRWWPRGLAGFTTTS
ncbi:hypothetical protein GCM10023216_28040 [Isoptericola chiayiensis]|uniref:Pyrrolo-quinoline quinone repeat domain-containing protein n=1 Tax=Isoptericola chiayiensis TaxID=579446 RepID=A0ABP8YQX4_9MICO|nr:hypothetical protein [Isoptericola chiayiensis]